jgi:hypothetical protein
LGAAASHRKKGCYPLLQVLDLEGIVGISFGMFRKHAVGIWSIHVDLFSSSVAVHHFNVSILQGSPQRFADNSVLITLAADSQQKVRWKIPAQC